MQELCFAAAFCWVSLRCSVKWNLVCLWVCFALSFHFNLRTIKMTARKEMSLETEHKVRYKIRRQNHRTKGSERKARLRFTIWHSISAHRASRDSKTAATNKSNHKIEQHNKNTNYVVHTTQEEKRINGPVDVRRCRLLTFCFCSSLPRRRAIITFSCFVNVEKCARFLPVHKDHHRMAEESRCNRAQTID